MMPPPRYGTSTPDHRIISMTKDGDGNNDDDMTAAQGAKSFVCE